MSAKTIKILTMIYGYRHDACALKLPPKTDTRFKSIDRNTSDSVLSTLLSFATHSLSMSLFSQSGESQKPLGHSLHDGLIITGTVLLHFTT